MIRKTRKINKMRGSRSIGGGCTKKRRGAGHKGGKGKAGLGKHHWTWTVKNDPNHFGKYGFKRPQKMTNKIKPVNIGYLDDNSEKLLAKGIATKEGDTIVIDVTDLGYGKVLGKGNLLKPLIIKSPAFSASAEDKIQEAGGEAIKL
ncbi:MAG: 50S ribosomal protein L15 [Methanobrevibacter arboriphilus]|jgi:large subunit ribosomal protein L15|uniref:50S ribosomal protein L15 n=2 Tax=Methanobrevibacter arboriphilus TaxID=39441 RepID=A0ACA8R2R7_METAZ|nr:uL15 family ribosomal protein [Methanobrevibacter arboriphilus]MBF4468181.1 50S ribosomal protein L15 [Methanobrevibacter arboriphilus]MCC7562008.1 50S ribosomal protein L15 [Methanobrevibacter arboriphilus]BBL61608.1 50S ribosomal protein L15 [Methanobrevibacter arboriphilus]GLI12520.1 50S ribosomal protein L15 [Methanobrevibacter arboriphilus]